MKSSVKQGVTVDPMGLSRHLFKRTQRRESLLQHSRLSLTVTPRRMVHPYVVLWEAKPRRQRHCLPLVERAVLAQGNFPQWMSAMGRYAIAREDLRHHPATV